MEEILAESDIDWTNVVVVSCLGSWLQGDQGFDLSSKDFLRFAKTDQKTSCARGYINALTNAKRAIDCQTDQFIRAIGLDYNAAFPKSVSEYLKTMGCSKSAARNFQVVESLGVDPIGLISKYRTLRNKLEHYYEEPDAKDVSDAVEFAELYVRAVDNAMRSIAAPVIESEKSLSVSIEYAGSGVIQIRLFTNDEEYKVFKTKSLDKNSEYFMPLMKLCISTGTEIGWDEAIKEFIHVYNRKIPIDKIIPELDYG